MKTFFLIIFPLLAFIQCLTDKQTSDLKNYHMECFNETRVEPDKILALKSGNWHIENKRLKKWILCLLNKFDLMSNEGVFKLDTAFAMIPPKDRSNVEKAIDECLPKTASAPYNIAWSYTKCYHLKAKKPVNKKKNLHYLLLF